MPELVQVDQSIEGDAIEGQSRDPLKNRGWMRVNGQRCSTFVATFDVRGEVTRPLAPDAQRIEPDAVTSPGNKVICEKALIHSVKEKHRTSVAKGSASHQ